MKQFRQSFRLRLSTMHLVVSPRYHKHVSVDKHLYQPKSTKNQAAPNDLANLPKKSHHKSKPHITATRTHPTPVPPPHRSVPHTGSGPERIYSPSPVLVATRQRPVLRTHHRTNLPSSCREGGTVSASSRCLVGRIFRSTCLLCSYNAREGME